MATTPVRIRREDKARLERLREDITAATGKRRSQQELVGDVVEFAVRHREEFLAETAWRPFNQPEVDRWLKDVKNHKGWKAVPAEEINRVVYGEG